MFVTGLLVGCGAHARPNVTPAVAPTSFKVTPSAASFGGPELPIVPDPTAVTLTRVESEVGAGERELRAGRLTAARGHFDAAVDVLLALPDGARSEPRLAAAFDRLLDRISALDLIAVREGDGLTETRSEPAAIDELLGAAMFERPTPAATTAETVRSELQRASFDLEIEPNDKVLSYVELFQGRLHDFMEAGLERSLTYLPMIRDVFKAEGVPADLAYVPLIESAFKPTALSRASARGMWQFMPGTAREHGLDQSWFIDERADPEKATRAAAKYLKSLATMFDGDWNLALASYNAGPGRLQTAIKRARTADFWALSASTRYLPRETREYVPMIMAATVIARNPGLYGFTVGAGDPLAYERVTVPNALDLKIIAEWIGVSVDQLRALNTELRRTTTPMGDHELKVPLGTAVTLRQKLVTADPSLFVKFNFHTVRRGETLTAIARKYKIPVPELRAANDLGSRARVRANQSLMIPQRSASPLATTSSATAVARATTSSARTAQTASGSAAGRQTTYRVQRGDTLFGIARRFETTVAALKQLNGMRGNQINVGDRLTLR
ncbi:MAG: transglycosylase SLT domain-containing protein [Acidobacteria bacterium]|nr:transglycosylase SLT domain-containing protein [Acidobacteriota bacterium]